MKSVFTKRAASRLVAPGNSGPPRQCKRAARNRHRHEAPDGRIDHDRKTRDVVGLRRGRIDETAGDLEGEGQADSLAALGGLADDRLHDRQAEHVVRDIQAATAHVALLGVPGDDYPELTSPPDRRGQLHGRAV